MITVEFDNSTMALSMRGHSDTQKCAGISALFGSLAYSLTRAYDAGMLEANVSIREEDGECSIACKAKEGFEANISLMYWTVLNGVEMIAKKYPEEVSFLVKTG